jgi:hypothetical protein
MQEREKPRRVNILIFFVVLLFFVAGYFIGGYRGAKIYEETVKEQIQETDLPNFHHLEVLKLQLETDSPLEKIKDDLQKRRDLIPEDPVMGGTMAFYNREDIHIITDKWVLASYEDGHIGGYILLEFEVLEDDTIEWKLVSSALD